MDGNESLNYCGTAYNTYNSFCNVGLIELNLVAQREQPTGLTRPGRTTNTL